MGEIGEKMQISGKELGLESLGITDIDQIYRNLSIDELIDETVNNNEGIIGANGASIVDTGKYTGRSPKDKYIVDEPSSTDNIWWGPVNKKIDETISLTRLNGKKGTSKSVPIRAPKTLIPVASLSAHPASQTKLLDRQTSRVPLYVHQ